jgi:four helix bundle protein
MEGSHRDLLAWQKAMELVGRIYQTVRTFPRYELFGLSSQMRRAAISVPCNIAEGQGRFAFRDFRRFLREARASLLELETQVLIAQQQEYLSAESAESLLVDTARVGQLINGLIRNIERRLQRTTENGERTTPTNRAAP